MNIENFNTLEELATKLRESDKKTQLLFAHNGVGKTRLSRTFKEIGDTSDTLYFNAFTEDLFHWDNDLENDTVRVLELKKSKFFAVLEGEGFDIESNVKKILNYYADFDFSITSRKVSFSRKVVQDGKNDTVENIKISRGEENIFVWSFFLAIAQLAIDEQESYNWVKYIYIDDPISSLDDNNVITVASHLAQLIRNSDNKKFIISTHHGLFYNVIFNELKKSEKYLLTKNSVDNNYRLESLTKDTPFYQHIGILKELYKVAKNGTVYTYHFSLLRNILEKTAAFHGFEKFSDCIKVDGDDVDEIIHARRINILNHGNYSIFDPQIMQDENKEHFKKVLEGLIKEYQFNSKLFTTQGRQS